MTAERTCVACGTSLAGRRPQARFCSPACRREANRLARLAAGEADGQYLTLEQYSNRRRTRFARFLRAAEHEAAGS
jgi:hypothetical protein